MENFNKRRPVGDQLWVRFCVSVCLFAAMLLATVGAVNAQGKITGFVVDDEFEAPLEKAVITIPGTFISVLTDQQGKYELKMMPGDYFMEVNYPGYFAKKYNVTVSEGITTPMFIVKLQANRVGEAELRRITDRLTKPDFAGTVENYSLWKIDEQKGNQEFNEIFRNIPSASFWGNGGGYNDSEIGFRGALPENTSYSFNGILLNNPETGKLSSPVLSGLTDWAGSIQVVSGQSGSIDGRSKSGGTIVIGSYLPQEQKGVEVEGIGGNGGFLKTSATYHSGLTKKGLASTVRISRTTGDGLMQNTGFAQYSFFANVYKRFSHRHAVAINLNGTLQKYDRNFPDSVGAYNLFGPKFNRSWGLVNEKPVSWSTNLGSSPMLSVTHFWQPRIKTFVTTQGFVQLGREAQFLSGELLGEQQNTPVPVHPASVERQPVHAAISRENRFGLKTIVTRRLSKKLDVRTSLDLEDYRASHFGAIHDMPSGETYVSRADLNRPDGFPILRQFSPSFFPVYKVDQSDYYFESQVQTAGFSLRMDYRHKRISGFMEGSASLQNLLRTDHFNYLADDDRKKAHAKFLPGGKFLAGIRLGLWKYHSVFFRTGFGSYQPLFSHIFPLQNNWKNDGITNEQVFDSELGYVVFSRKLKIEASGYWTLTKNGSIVNYFESAGDRRTGLINGLGEERRGIELKTSYKLTRNFQFNLNGSLGEWKYRYDATAQVYTRDNEVVQENDLWLTGVKIANAPQMSLFAEAEYRWAHNFYVRLNYYRAEKIVAPFGIDDFARLTSRDEYRQWQLPYYHLVGVSGNYLLKIRKLGEINLLFGGNNLLDTEYIGQTATNIPEGTPAYTANVVSYGQGRTWFAGIKVLF